MGKNEDYWVSDISLADEGKSAVIETLRDMPGISELERIYKDKKPLNDKPLRKGKAQELSKALNA